MREMDRLVSMLFPREEHTLVDLKFFPGEQPVTLEEFCEEAHSAFLQVESGQATEAAQFPEELTCVGIDKFLSDA